MLRSGGNAPHPSESEDSASEHLSQDAGQVMARGLKPSRVIHSSNFYFVNIASTSVISRYATTIYFEGREGDYCVTSSNFCYSAFSLAEFLHRNHYVNNFDLLRHGRKLDYNSIICSGDVICVSGGFDLYLADAWNRIMHSINGNMENDRDSERTHLPVDKKFVKASTTKNEKAIEKNKNRRYLAGDAKLKNRNGLHVFGKRTYAPKVYVEKSAKEIAADKVTGNLIDVTGEDNDIPPTSNPWNKSIAKPVPSNNQVPSVEKKKEEEKEKAPMTTEGEFNFIDEYKIDYYMSDSKPSQTSINNCYVFGYMRKYYWIPFEPNQDQYYLGYFLFILFSLLVLFSGFLDNFAGPVAISATKLKMSPDFDFVGKSMSQTIYYGLYIPLFQLLFEVVCFSFVPSPLLTRVGPQLSLIFLRVLFIFAMWKGCKLFYRKYHFLIGYIRRAEPGATYYTKKVNPKGIFTDIIEDNNDPRIESDKNFKITQSSKISKVVDSLITYHPIGYFDWDGKWIETERTIASHEIKEYEVNLEIVTQMCSPKNMASTISAEAVLERVANSNNCAPFVYTDRSWIFEKSLIENSARYASVIILAHRFSVQKVDMYDQLFRQGDRLRLGRSPQ